MFAAFSVIDPGQLLFDIEWLSSKNGMSVTKRVKFFTNLYGIFFPTFIF